MFQEKSDHARVTVFGGAVQRRLPVFRLKATTDGIISRMASNSGERTKSTTDIQNKTTTGFGARLPYAKPRRKVDTVSDDDDDNVTVAIRYFDQRSMHNYTKLLCFL